MKIRIIGLCVFFLALFVIATPALADGPGEDIRQSQGLTYTQFLPIILKNYPPSYTPSITWSTTLEPCVDDTRGPLYRSLVTDTARTWSWPYAWSMAACYICSEGLAYTRGYYIGQGLAHIPSIMVKIVQLVLSVVGSGVSSLLSVFGVIDAPESAYSISCSEDAENLCLGIALIASVDDMSGGWVSVVITLLIGVMSFYLGTYVIKEIRAILDSSSGGEE